MILRELSSPALLYRALTPKWAIAPCSGAGAASVGGRFNRPGVEALYLSLEEITALAEYKQAASLLQPATICAYLAQLRPLVDVGRLDSRWDALWQDWHLDWRNLAFGHRQEPPSWVLGDLVRAAGHPGIIFPSMVTKGGTNVVLYLDMFTSSEKISVHDPEGRLPKDQRSWPTPG